MSLEWGIWIAVFVWLVVLSFFILKIRGHYTKLTARTKTGSIDDVLEEILAHDARFEKNLADIAKKTKDLEDATKNHYQRLGFVRFNPFDRVGGDQSFVIALLDTKDTGIVLNFLYTRDGIRVYAKRVEGGKSADYDLSSEEKEAIQNAH